MSTGQTLQTGHTWNTHDVLNQVDELTDFNLLEADPAARPRDRLWRIVPYEPARSIRVLHMSARALIEVMDLRACAQAGGGSWRAQRDRSSVDAG